MTNKKPLAIVENDEELKALKENLDKGCDMFKDAQEFIKKQAEESWNQLIGCHYTDIENLLKERNLLPDDYEYGLKNNSEKYNIGFTDGVLYLVDKSKDPKDQFVKSLMDLFTR